MDSLNFLIASLGVINLFRMTLYLIGADIYTLIHHLQREKRRSLRYMPNFSVIIPAHNEERTIVRCVDSVIKNDYPMDKLEIIVVDDGSTDKTLELVKKYKKEHNLSNLIIIKQSQLGKANALNNGMKNIATGEYVMCLDADSYLSLDAIKKSAEYFQGNEKIVALASNVKIIPTKGILNLIQRYEYTICYQMKRAQSFFNIEYIIGGIGSTFKRSFLEQIDFYDGNTMTEDIDITMKILQKGNKDIQVKYGSDVIAYTESVLNLSGLIKQRFRWKYGRNQTFYKNRNLFFNSSSRYSKGLTFLNLPSAIFFDLAFFLEPIIVAYIIFIVIAYADLVTLISAYIVITIYMILNVFAEETYSIREKIELLFMAPLIYFLFYILSFVEYMALLKTLFQIHLLKKSLLSNSSTWQHVERREVAM